MTHSSKLWELHAGSPYPTDKNQHYLDFYSSFLEPYQSSTFNLLEIGVDRAGSLSLWKDYFPNAHIYGLDIAPPAIDSHPRLYVGQADQANHEDLSRTLNEWGNPEFQFIIDDASHLGRLSAATFLHMFPTHLAAGGVYFFEDWGTGYWNHWPDGEEPTQSWNALTDVASAGVYPPYDKFGGAHRIPSHTAGMVGLMKLLIDIMAAADQPTATAPGLAIASMHLQLGVAAVRKAR